MKKLLSAVACALLSGCVIAAPVARECPNIADDQIKYLNECLARTPAPDLATCNDLSIVEATIKCMDLAR